MPVSDRALFPPDAPEAQRWTGLRSQRRVPQPVPPSTHTFKYRAAYSVGGVRLVGFDNERGKGDHCHFGGRELAYAFVSVEQLVEDFIAAVEAVREK